MVGAIMMMISGVEKTSAGLDELGYIVVEKEFG